MNPFKSVGAWIGAGIILAAYIMWNNFCIRYSIREGLFPSSFVQGIFGNCGDLTLTKFIIFILLIVLGFFIGYGIHSLIRGIRK